MNLREKTIKSIGIISGLQVFNQSVAFISAIVLARLLLPSDFGVVGIAFMVIGAIELFDKLGIESAIIHRKEDIQEALSTGFIMNLCLVSSLFIVAIIVAPIATPFFNSPQATNVIRLLSLNFIINSLGFVPRIKLNKELEFRKIAVSEMANRLTYAGLSIPLAFAGFGFWSLVYATLAGNIVGLAVITRLSPWRQRFCFNKVIARQLFDYGKYIFLTSVAGFLFLNLDKGLVGKIIGIAALGYYTMAQNWANRIVSIFSNIINRVMFPAYAKIKDERERLRNGYLKTIKYLGLVTFPLTFGLVAIAPEFVKIVLSEKWIPAIIPLQILCICGLLRIFADVSSSVFLATGKTGLASKCTIAGLLLVLALGYPFTRYMGIIGVSAVVTLAACLSSGMILYYLKNILELKIYSLFRVLALPAMASLVMIAAVWLTKNYLIPQSKIYSLLVLIFIGMLAYGGVLFALTKGKLIAESKELFILMLRRPRREIVEVGPVAP